MSSKGSLITVSVLFFVFILGGGFLFSQAGDETPKKEPPAYTIGPMDVLLINVIGVPELNTSVRVSETGAITLPLLGTFEVTGLSPHGLEVKLIGLLEKNYLNKAYVSVAIKEYNSRQAAVIGAVSKSGSYPLIGQKNLMHLLAEAGWVTKEASGLIQLIRRDSKGKRTVTKVYLTDLLSTDNAESNPLIKPGDLILVMQQLLIDVYIFGEVNRPGIISMNSGTEMTMLKAIAQAGGFGDRARKSRITVRRTVNGKTVKIRVNVKKILKGKIADFQLKDNDIIFVPESLL